MVKEDNKRGILQLAGSSFVVIAGFFVIASMANNITGRVIGNSQNVPILEISIALWGILIMVVGIWMIRKKDFHKSIFD